MELSTVVEQLGELDDDLTIYIRDSGMAGADSAVVLAYEPDDGSTPEEADGMEYFLEVALAKDAVRVWSEWREGRVPSVQEAVRAITYYAQHDAFLPVAPSDSIEDGDRQFE